MKWMAMAMALPFCALAVSSAAAGPPEGSRYVAMGSSYASGPGLGKPAAGAPARCARSEDNYAHRLARRHALTLVDVSCGGAFTTHILAAWNELPAQIDAVDGATRLVTVTIGGNDLKYVRQLAAYSCAGAQPTAAADCPTPGVVSEEDYAGLEQRMGKIAGEVKRRAPQAELVFVQYPAVLPRTGVCATTPMTMAQADALRTTAARLAEITARVARETGAGLIETDKLSVGHDACSDTPWMNGYRVAGPPGNGVIYHPNAAGMAAQADALDHLLWPSQPAP